MKNNAAINATSVLTFKCFSNMNMKYPERENNKEKYIKLTILGSLIKIERIAAGSA